MAQRYCTNCGNELADGIRFCGNCGQPVGEPSPEPQARAERPSEAPEQTRPPEREEKSSSAPLVAFLIPVFALMALAWWVGPERFGFQLGSNVLVLAGLVLMVVVAVLLLWAVGRLFGGSGDRR